MSKQLKPLSKFANESESGAFGKAMTRPNI
jgi:hypothetical protein